MRETSVQVPELQQDATSQPAPRPSKAQRNEGPKTLSAAEGRHSLKCAVCNHPDRAAIEFDFLNWRNPADLVKGYRFRSLSTIYRHAHATGLFAKRRLNLRFAMERIVERVNEVPVTANAVIRAARAIARINDSGQWNDPPTRLIIEHVNSDAAEGSARLESSRTRRSHGQKGVGHSRATSHSSLATVFDEVLLDEPSDSASGELPKIPGEGGRAAPEEVILTISPEFYRCREERKRAIEEDQRAKAAAKAPSGPRSGGFTPPASNSGEAEGAAPVEDPERNRRAPVSPQTENMPSSSSSTRSADPVEDPEHSRRERSRMAPAEQADSSRGTAPCPERSRMGQPVLKNPSSLPQAALEQPAPSAERSAPRATDHDSRNTSLSSPPQAALEQPARSAESSASRATDHDPRNTSFSSPPRPSGPPLGSSGSANPPFPFTPEPLRRWKPRRRF